MNDPYTTLGVSRSSSDEDIKKAYRELARKYHPDNYADNPLADLAQEKMKQINEAYDTIQKERAAGGARQSYSQGYSSASQSYSQSGSYNAYSGRSGHSAGAYADARAAINAGDLNRAEMILGSITERNAEWHFLMGSLSFRRGWMDEAARYYNMAMTMDPSNPEYRQAVSYMNSTARQPYRGNTGGVSNSDPCAICGNLLVLDCCCEMLGGDFIPCC